ncbi:Reticulocyte-binding protein 2 a [Liparis tanakae]|uniref:Reticulocyte-binding protein 2 a n=1 Tax=Liparis tanakae TaxID=230148 RepID=A0A4Z2ET58_9TELE|nr:Reticulocyte-binding protein 2 a [Liparis tanakae]
MKGSGSVERDVVNYVTVFSSSWVRPLRHLHAPLGPLLCFNIPLTLPSLFSPTHTAFGNLLFYGSVHERPTEHASSTTTIQSRGGNPLCDRRRTNHESGNQQHDRWTDPPRRLRPGVQRGPVGGVGDRRSVVAVEISSRGDGRLFGEPEESSRPVDSTREDSKRLQREESKRLQREEPKRLQREESKRLQREEPKRLQREEPKRLQREEPKRLQSIMNEEPRRRGAEETRRRGAKEPRSQGALLVWDQRLEAVIVCSSERLSCTFNPETKWKETGVNLPHTHTHTHTHTHRHTHTHTHTHTVGIVPTKRGFCRPEITDLTGTVAQTHTRTHTHTHTHTHRNTHAHTHTHTHRNTHAHTHTHTHTHTHIETHMHTHTGTHTCTHKHMHTYTHARTQTHLHAHTDTHTYKHPHCSNSTNKAWLLHT